MTCGLKSALLGVVCSLNAGLREVVDTKCPIGCGLFCRMYRVKGGCGMFSDLVCREACQCDSKQDII